MIFMSFWKKPSSAPDIRPAIPSGRRVYAVGDIHGRDDLLADLLERIEDDHASRTRAQTTIVFLGDLIDRGPYSRGVIERLMTYRRDGLATAFLMGNHEDVLVRILAGDGSLVRDWLRFGGAACAKSYGLDPDRLGRIAPGKAAAEIGAAIPAAHQAFLEGFCDTLTAGGYLFVHAGIRPGVPIQRQRPEDLRWIRSPFLDHPGRHELFVVHGHTIREKVDEAEGRIGIDTGAYQSGVLTAIGLEGTDRWILEAREQTDSDRLWTGGNSRTSLLSSAAGGAE